MTNTAPQAQAHPPLARDTQGNFVSVPDGTASWRIRRKTTGRPRDILGHDKEPIRFPLDTTCEQLVEMCGRDVYRVYALDEVGEMLEHVTTLDLTGEAPEQPRNSSGNELAVVGRASPVGSTDLRFALEAMTQMMRTNAEALRTVTDAHVDLSKSMAAAKGLRNAALFMPREPEPEEEEPVDEPERPKTWVDLAMPFAEQLASAVPVLVAGNLAGGVQSPSNDVHALPEQLTEEEALLVEKPNWELKDFLDFRYAKRKADAKRKHGAATAGAIPEAVKARITSDPQLMQKLFAIKAQLTEDELGFLMGAIANASELEQTCLLDQLKAASAEEAVALCRELVSELRNANAQRAGN